MEEREVADDCDHRVAPAAGRPRARSTRLRRSRSHPGWRAPSGGLSRCRHVPLEVADGHRGRDDERRPVRRRLSTRQRAKSGLGGLGVTGAPAVHGGLRLRLGECPPLQPGIVSICWSLLQMNLQVLTPRGGIGSHDRGCVTIRIRPSPVTVDEHLPCSRTRPLMEAAGQDLRGVKPSEPDNHIRSQRGRSRIVSEQGVSRRDHSS